MYIEPNSTIKLLRNVPLDNTYNHTILFDSATEQYDYFNGKTKYTFTDQTYQRVVKGRMRVAVKADSVYDCNYLMFRNVNFGTKWFYAFITGIEYLNNEACEISFEIDSYQTYMFDVEVGDCFIDREHSATDEVGDNILPENVNLGEVKYDSYAPVIPELTSYTIVVAVIEDGTVGGKLYNGVYGGATLYAFESSDLTPVNNFLVPYVSHPQDVVGIYLVPSMVQAPTNSAIPTSTTGYTRNITQSFYKVNPLIDYFDGYHPKNKKLYTYPYNYIHVDNSNGGEMNLRYEYFDGGVAQFKLIGTLLQPCQLKLIPRNYKGVEETSGVAFFPTGLLHTETLTLEYFPVCCWASDSFLQWALKELPSGILNTGAGVASAVALPSFSTIASAVTSAGNLLTSAYEASLRANYTSGKRSTGSLNCAAHIQNFYIAKAHIDGQYARVIDEYFTMFGYACREVKKPNVFTSTRRPKYNYVKTVGAVLTKNNCPVDDARKICSILDNGITFWNNGVTVGDYSVDNSPS